MKIHFSRISKTPYTFDLSLDGVAFSGYCVKESSKFAKLNMCMKGSKDIICDSCGDDLRLNIDENIELLLSDGEFKDSGGSLKDIVEFYDGYIDFIELCEGELEAFLSSYFYCENCKEKQ